MPRPTERTIYTDPAFHQKLKAAAKADRRSIKDFVAFHLEPIINNLATS